MRQAFPAATKRAPLWGALFVFGGWLSLASGVRGDDCRPPAALHAAQVVRVVDGDTLRLIDGRRIRLIGIDAPELGRAGRSDEPFAVAARRRLEKLVSDSDGRVRLSFEGRVQDRHGRYLAHVFGADRRSWEAELLRAGLGFAVAMTPSTALGGCLFAAERSARAAGRGLWRRSPVLEPGQLRRSGFALVRGQVLAVERNAGGLWLELDGGLVLRVAPEALGHFDERRLRRLVGRQVEARGWVVERSARDRRARWLLPITHPAMLELR